MAIKFSIKLFRSPDRIPKVLDFEGTKLEGQRELAIFGLRTLTQNTASMLRQRGLTEAEIETELRAFVAKRLS